MTGDALSTWVDADRLTQWVHDSRRRVMELVEDLSDEQLVGPLIATINPLIWEIGHLAWFQERFLLRDALQREPIIAHCDALWDSGAVPHDTRWFLDLPSRDDTLQYMRQVRDRVAEAVTEGLPPAWHRLALYTVFHEDTHTEALTYTRQTLQYPAPTITQLSHTAPDTVVDAGAHRGDVDIDGGTFLLGATGAEPFVYDNEKWCHRVEVQPFSIAKAPVTQAQFAEFVEDGGYQRPLLWVRPGWSWRTRTRADHPVYWRRSDSGWERRVFDEWRALEPHRPVVHVCWYEAEAFCRWAGRRLPTEAEWELAATGAANAADDGGAHGTTKRRYPWGDEEPAAQHANLDWRAMDTVDVAAYPDGDSVYGCRQMIGNVWEWTGSTFAPYPNFEQDTYRDNSWPWFGSRKVLRGGAWATRGRYVRNTYRNYFTPDRRDVFAGFRTCVSRG